MADCSGVRFNWFLVGEAEAEFLDEEAIELGKGELGFRKFGKFGDSLRQESNGSGEG